MLVTMIGEIVLLKKPGISSNSAAGNSCSAAYASDIVILWLSMVVVEETKMVLLLMETKLCPLPLMLSCRLTLYRGNVTPTRS